MTVFALFPQYLSINKNYRYYTKNESMLANDYDFFSIFNLFSILVKNNNLNFDEFITNCKAISFIFTLNKYKKKRNVRNNSYNNVKKFVVKCIFEQSQKIKLFFAIEIIIYKTKLIVKKY